VFYAKALTPHLLQCRLQKLENKKKIAACKKPFSWKVPTVAVLT